MNLRAAFTVVAAAFALAVVACANHVGQSCTTTADCGTHEVCNYLPVACTKPCATQGICYEEPDTRLTCSTPPVWATSCASGKQLVSYGCATYFTEPVRDYPCR